MQYLHPDVLSGGPLLIQNAATSIMLLPQFDVGMSYADALDSALLVANLSPASFSLLQANGNSIFVLNSVTASAINGSASNTGRHLAITDGVSRLLWVDEETSNQPIFPSQNYVLPQMTLISEQLESEG